MASVEPRGRIRGRIPRPVVAAIKERCRDHGGLVELGAGTGVLTGALTRAGCRVAAVDHDVGALAQLARSVPDAPVMQASGDALPLWSESVQMFVVNLLGDVSGSSASSVDHDSRSAALGCPDWSELRRVVTADALVMVLRPMGHEDPLVRFDWLHKDRDEVVHGEPALEVQVALSQWVVRHTTR